MTRGYHIGQTPLETLKYGWFHWFVLMIVNDWFWRLPPPSSIQVWSKSPLNFLEMELCNISRAKLANIACIVNIWGKGGHNIWGKIF